MHCTAFLIPMLPLAAKAVNVVISNDDGEHTDEYKPWAETSANPYTLRYIGWAEINIREFYYSLVNAGFSAIISAPAENESGTGSLDVTPTTVGSSGCEFSSCPAGSPPEGNNASMPRFNVSIPLSTASFSAD